MNKEKERKEMIRAIKNMEMEMAINDLKKEAKRYRGNDTFATSFAKYFKLIEKARFKADIRDMKQAIKEEKKRLKNIEKMRSQNQ